MILAQVLHEGRVLAEARHATREDAAAWCAHVAPSDAGFTTRVRPERRGILRALLRRVS